MFSDVSQDNVSNLTKIPKTHFFPMSLHEITDKEFEQHLTNAEQPVLAYFWAPWCGPCRLVSPSIKALADQYGDRLKVLKLEVDPNPITARKYKVEGVPAIRLLKNDEVVVSHEGAITKDKLQALLDPHLGD
ncbi:MAG: thioredoxin family protein [Snowella sp.]|nr:thioredoxin family protein [Snowella sp.]